MGCSQSADTDVHIIICKDNITPIPSPTCDSDDDTSVYGTDCVVGYDEIQEQLSKLIELHNSVSSIKLVEPSFDQMTEETTPTGALGLHTYRDRILEKLKEVHYLRAVYVHGADLDTLTAQEDVRLQLCEFFSCEH